MRLKSIFISTFLVFTYTLSFAHSLIPHCSEPHQHENDANTHHHHSHEQEGAHEGHDHIQHLDHFDEGLYDLLICFLSDLDHEPDDGHHIHLATDQNFKTLGNSTSAVLLICLFNLEKNENNRPVYSQSVSGLILSPYPEPRPDRGPPVLS